MRSFAAFTRVCTWVLLVFICSVQALAIVGIAINDSQKAFNPWLLGIASVVMIVSTILFFALPRGKSIPFILAAADAVFFIVLAFMLKNAFPVVFAVDGSDSGVSLWTAIWRHMSPILIPLCMLPTWILYLEDRSAEKNADAENRTPSYLDIIDETYTMRSLDDEDAKAPTPKRSVRIRMRKTEGNLDTSNDI